jgi:coenzyme PQQ synthesis protein D (PqqD)
MPSPAAHRPITTASLVVAAKDQVSSDLAGEAVILSLRTGMYYGLGQVGARIWQLLATPTRVRDIRDEIVGRYDVEPDRCERDLVNFLHQLAIRELIDISDGTAP